MVEPAAAWRCREKSGKDPEYYHVKSDISLARTLHGPSAKAVNYTVPLRSG